MEHGLCRFSHKNSACLLVFGNLGTVLGASCSVGAGATSYLLGITGCKVFKNSKE